MDIRQAKAVFPGASVFGPGPPLYTGTLGRPHRDGWAAFPWPPLLLGVPGLHPLLDVYSLTAAGMTVAPVGPVIGGPDVGVLSPAILPQVTG